MRVIFAATLAAASEARRAVVIGLTFAVAACASIGRPPGGPVDETPPQVIGASINSNATGVKAGKLEIQFDEVIAERPSVVAPAGSSSPVTLEAIVLVSPRTGTAKVSWHRRSIAIEPRGGFRENTTYRITLLPGLSDIRGNVSKQTLTYQFSTGPTIEPYAILGRVFDWMARTPAPGAIVEAVANPGTADSLIYIAVADSLGQFDVGPLGAGRYLVRSYIDADHNRDRGVLEKWDTLTVTVTDHRPSVELLDAQRDTAVVGIRRVEVLDSAWIRVELDKPFDPSVQLLPSMVAIRRSDSSDVQVEAVMTDDRAQVLRPRAGGAAGAAGAAGARRDTVAAATDTTAGRAVAAPTSPARATIPPTLPTTPPTRPTTPPTTAPVETPLSTRPPDATPSRPRPLTAIVVQVNPLTPIRPGERYTLVVRALPNLLGRIGTSSGVFDAPRPPARPPE